MLSPPGKTIIVFPGRDRLQREYLAPLLWPHGNAIADRAPQYLLHGVLIRIIQIQVTVSFIAFQDAFAFQKPGHALADRMHQLHQFLLFRKRSINPILKIHFTEGPQASAVAHHTKIVVMTPHFPDQGFEQHR
jgi:hypothetical protein